MSLDLAVRDFLVQVVEMETVVVEVAVILRVEVDLMQAMVQPNQQEEMQEKVEMVQQYLPLIFLMHGLWQDLLMVNLIIIIHTQILHLLVTGHLHKLGITFKGLSLIHI